MLLTRPLQVVTPTLDGDVLEVLAGADAAFTVAEVHTLVAAHSYNGVKKALRRLAGQGIVTHDQVGSVATYRLNREHLAAPAIIELAGLRAVLLTRLREVLGQWTFPPVHAAMFGSAAHGEMQADSDIDVFLVRAEWLDWESDALGQWDMDVAELASAVTRWTGNDTRILEMSESEVAAGLAENERVLADIRTRGVPLFDLDPGFWTRVRHG